MVPTVSKERASLAAWWLAGAEMARGYELTPEDCLRGEVLYYAHCERQDLAAEKRRNAPAYSAECVREWGGTWS